MKPARVSLLLAAGCLALAVPAHATSITVGGLTLDTAPSSFYQQNYVDPCVIGVNNCHNHSGFPWTHVPTGGSGYLANYLSPIYTVSQLQTELGTLSFIMGLDWNSSSNLESLYELEVIYSYASGPTTNQLWTYAGGLVLDANRQGNGYSDFLMSGFTIPGTATGVQFRAEWFDDDGGDRFFLIPAGTTPCDPNVPDSCPPLPDVPEPATLVLLGSGLATLALTMRRRAQRSGH